MARRRESIEVDEATGRNTTTIELSDAAMKAIDTYVSKRGGRGMKKFLLSKLAAWFAEQPDPVKAVVIGWVDEGMERAYAEALRQMAKDIESRREPAVVIHGARDA